MTTALDAFLAEAPGSQLVIDGSDPVEPGRYERVALVVRDRVELRATSLPRGLRTRALGVFVHDAGCALTLTPRPEWPALNVIHSRPVDDGWFTVLRFAARVPVHAVVA